MFIYPYKAGSASAKELSVALGAKRIKLENSAFKGNKDKTVINWGSSNLSDEALKCNVLNHPEAVSLASNKLKFFNHMVEYNEGNHHSVVNVPKHTTSRTEAASWISDGGTVVERHILQGNSGVGIELCDNVNVIGDAPLYVQYVPKKQEYRIHVADGKVVDSQRKARRRDIPDNQINWKIRNHDNGFIFQRNDLDIPYGVHKQSILACKAVGLDFGAVDIIYNESQEKAYVLEINTAPGLAGSTLDGYVERFDNWGKEKVSALEALIGAEAVRRWQAIPMPTFADEGLFDLEP